MPFIVSLDARPVVTALGQYQNQFPFAVSLALNDLAIQAADVQRREMRTTFTIRNENVLKYGIVRTERATKASLASAVGVSETRTGTREAFGYLKKFERGGVKGPIRGRTVAIPVDARRTKRGIVAASQRIAALHLTKRGTQVTGLKRTFLIQPKSGRAAGLILQRVGRGKKVRLLYVLERSVPIRPILRLADTVTKFAQQQWPRIMQQAAVATVFRKTNPTVRSDLPV